MEPQNTPHGGYSCPQFVKKETEARRVSYFPEIPTNKGRKDWKPTLWTSRAPCSSHPSVLLPIRLGQGQLCLPHQTGSSGRDVSGPLGISETGPERPSRAQCWPRSHSVLQTLNLIKRVQSGYTFPSLLGIS